MDYLFIEILVCLLVAGAIGFIFGWLTRGSYKENSIDNDRKPEIKESSIKSDTDTNIKKEDEDPNPTDILFLDTPRDGKKDDLSRIKGVGKVLEERLNTLGVYHFDQIASWSQEQQAWVDSYLMFPKKVEREEWIKQAKELIITDSRSS